MREKSRTVVCLGRLRSLFTLFVILPLALCQTVIAADYVVQIQSDDPAEIGTPITFGALFGPDEIPYNKILSGSLRVGSDSWPVKFQVDRKSSHCSSTDSSQVLRYEFQSKINCPDSNRFLRHAVVTLILPTAIDANQRMTFSVGDSGQNTEERGSPQSFPTNLGAETRILIDNETWVADISNQISLLSGNNLPETGTGAYDAALWLDGPLVSEWTVKVPLVNANAPSIEHSELTARYGIRHYPETGISRVEVVIENVDIVGDEMRSYNYDVSVNIDNTLRYRDSSLDHFPHARWRMVFWQRQQPDFHIEHDPVHLMATGAVPNYLPDLIKNISKATRERIDNHWSENKPAVSNGRIDFPSKEVECYADETLSKREKCGANGLFELAVNTVGPMGVGGIPIWYMPNTGGRPEIGPLPRWTAIWLLDQTESSAKTMLSIADSSGSWPVHLRDPATDMPVSVEAHPDKTFRQESITTGTRIFSCEKSAQCKKPYTADVAHQTSYAFVPFLITGDWYYLEEMQFWASYNAISMDVKARGFELGILERAQQLRGSAWALRNLAQVAYSTPDTHVLKNYYLNILRNNIDEWLDIYVNDPSRSNDYGAMVVSSFPITSPWMDDYFTWAVGYTIDLGYKSATPLAKWKGKFSVQRLSEGGATESDFCWVFAANYRLLLGPTPDIPSTLDPAIITVDMLRGPRTVPEPLTVFKDISSVFRYSNKATNGGYDIPRGGGIDNGDACGSAEQQASLGLVTGQINGKSHNPQYYIAQMGPALAAAVDHGTQGGDDAWSKYTGRSVLPDYSDAPTFAIVPRSNVGLHSPGECR